MGGDKGNTVNMSEKKKEIMSELTKWKETQINVDEVAAQIALTSYNNSLMQHVGDGRRDYVLVTFKSIEETVH